jgi:hypothetical protein
MAHRVAPRAEADLDDIWLYVAKESGSMDSFFSPPSPTSDAPAMKNIEDAISQPCSGSELIPTLFTWLPSKERQASWPDFVLQMRLDLLRTPSLPHWQPESAADSPRRPQQSERYLLKLDTVEHIVKLWSPVFGQAQLV